jgi:hypothetical protein
VSTAAQTIVSAAVTDVWVKVKQGFGRLLGKDDPHQTEIAERRLEQTRTELATASQAELANREARLARACEIRLNDLLDDNPDHRVASTQTARPWPPSAATGRPACGMSPFPVISSARYARSRATVP